MQALYFYTNSGWYFLIVKRLLQSSARHCFMVGSGLHPSIWVTFCFVLAKVALHSNFKQLIHLQSVLCDNHHVASTGITKETSDAIVRLTLYKVISNGINNVGHYGLAKKI
jgi:hypothetical protein